MQIVACRRQRCDAEYDVRWRRWQHPRSTRWTGPARARNPVERCIRQEEQQPIFYCGMYECGMTEWHNCHRTTLPCAKKCICCRTRLLFSCIGVSLLSIVCGVIWSVCMLSAWLRGWYCNIVMCSQHCQVLPWSTTPLRAADLRRVKLCGLALPDKKTSECMTSKKIQVWHSVCVEATTVLTLKLICYFHIVTLITLRIIYRIMTVVKAADTM